VDVDAAVSVGKVFHTMTTTTTYMVVSLRNVQLVGTYFVALVLVFVVQWFNAVFFFQFFIVVLPVFLLERAGR
jgi:hypothetical protein